MLGDPWVMQFSRPIQSMSHLSKMVVRFLFYIFRQFLLVGVFVHVVHPP